jgi:hypothetical protein
MRLDQSPLVYRFLGVLPYAYDERGQIYYLLGQEWSGHKEDPYLWGSFGGKPEENDLTLYHGAARECYEESMGFLGEKKEILEKLLQTEKMYHTKKMVSFHIEISYDPRMPQLYQKVYDYSQKCLYYCQDGWFEKCRIDWWTPEEIVERKKEMRPKFWKFFRKMI